MRNEVEKFHETVGVLAKAYMNNTLIHGKCTACAVGTICGGRWEWGAVFSSEINSLDGFILTINQFTAYGEDEAVTSFLGMRSVSKIESNSLRDRKQDGLKVISETGYTPKELARVEYAFEQVIIGRPAGKYQDEDMFNGLMAVVDVLADIHGIDLSVKEESKLLFVKA